MSTITASAPGKLFITGEYAVLDRAPAMLTAVDVRAAAEIGELTERIGAGKILERCGNALTSQSVGPKILWLKRHRPEAARRRVDEFARERRPGIAGPDDRDRLRRRLRVHRVIAAPHPVPVDLQHRQRLRP